MACYEVPFQIPDGFVKYKNRVVSLDWIRKQDWLCWREPAEIYPAESLENTTRIRWREEDRNLWLENLKVSGDPGVDGGIILVWILEKRWTKVTYGNSGKISVSDICKNGDVPSGFMKVINPLTGWMDSNFYVTEIAVNGSCFYREVYLLSRIWSEDKFKSYPKET
jgi:hypothetical protein